MKTTFRGHDDWDNPDDDADPRGMPRPGAYPIRPAKNKNKQEYRGSRKDPNQLTFTQSDDSDPTPPYGYYRP